MKDDACLECKRECETILELSMRNMEIHNQSPCHCAIIAILSTIMEILTKDEEQAYKVALQIYEEFMLTMALLFDSKKELLKSLLEQDLTLH